MNKDQGQRQAQATVSAVAQEVAEVVNLLHPGCPVARDVDLQITPYVDKRGRTKQTFTCFLGDEAIEYVSRDNWERLGAIFGACYRNPELAARLANAVRQGTCTLAGMSNGAIRQRGTSLMG